MEDKQLMTAEQFIVQDLLEQRQRVVQLEEELASKQRALSLANSELRKIKEIIRKHASPVKPNDEDVDGECKGADGSYEMNFYISISSWYDGSRRRELLKDYQFMMKYFPIEEPKVVEPDTTEESKGDE